MTSVAQGRHERILSVALELAEIRGFRNITREMVAVVAQVGVGTVSWHFKGMDGLRDAVVRYAVEKKNIRVLAQALAEGHRFAKAAPFALRQEAAKFLMS